MSSVCTITVNIIVRTRFIFPYALGIISGAAVTIGLFFNTCMLTYYMLRLVSCSHTWIAKCFSKDTIAFGKIC